MKQHPETKLNFFLPVKTITVLIIVISVIGFMSFRFEGNNATTGNVNKDSIESVTAFMKVYKVLMSPCCMNCHPAGDVPLQGDDSHLHPQGVKRGPEGKGLYALKCYNCHQAEN